MNTGFPPCWPPLVMEGPPATGTVESPAVEQHNGSKGQGEPHRLHRQS